MSTFDRKILEQVVDWLTSVRISDLAYKYDVDRDEEYKERMLEVIYVRDMLKGYDKIENALNWLDNTRISALAFEYDTERNKEKIIRLLEVIKIRDFLKKSAYESMPPGASKEREVTHAHGFALGDEFWLTPFNEIPAMLGILTRIRQKDNGEYIFHLQYWDEDRRLWMIRETSLDEMKTLTKYVRPDQSGDKE